MADVNDSGTLLRPVMALLVGLLVLVGLIVWGTGSAGENPADLADRRDEPRSTDQDSVGTSGVATAVSAFYEFAAVESTAAAVPPPSPGHEYAAEGIRKLTAALAQMADDNSGGISRTRFGHFREQADRLQQDPSSGEHADVVRDVFIAAASAIGSLDAAAGDELTRLAESIQTEVPLPRQHDTVREYFRRAAEALQEHDRAS